MQQNLPIGIIGLGIIGSRIAAHLEKHGQPTLCWNRTPKELPNTVATLQELAERTRVIQIFTQDGKTLLAALESMKAQFTSEHLILNHATVDPTSTHAAHQLVTAQGASFLDAPFTGSREAARQGALVYYVSGDDTTYTRAKEILTKSSKEILYLGPIGNATMLKIATNMISATTVSILGEALQLLQAHGIDPSLLENAMQHNACASGVSTMKLPSILAENFDTHFSTQHMLKDANFAQALAEEKNLALPTHQSTINKLQTTAAAGKAHQDFSSIAELSKT